MVADGSILSARRCMVSMMVAIWLVCWSSVVYWLMDLVFQMVQEPQNRSSVMVVRLVVLDFIVPALIEDWLCTAENSR